MAREKGKRRSVEQQVRSVLRGMRDYGRGRHEVKKSGDTEVITSSKTLKIYEQECISFGTWCKEKGYGSNMQKQACHAEEWVMSYDSASSQKTKLSALRKFYGRDNPSLQFKTKARSRETITRGREVTKYEEHFSPQRHEPMVWVCVHTGLRREELKHLHGGCVSKHSDGHLYVDGVKGKGGRVRDIRILDDDSRTARIINNIPSSSKVFAHVHDAAPIHRYRGAYATELYLSEARPVSTLSRADKYHCRGSMKGVTLDRAAMKTVTKSMGHTRINVIAAHYLDPDVVK